MRGHVTRRASSREEGGLPGPARRTARAARRVVQMLHVRWIETSEVVARSVGGRASRSGRTFSGWSCRTGSGHERGFVRFEIGRHVGRARRRVARRAAFVGVRENAMRRYSESTAYVEHVRSHNFMQRKPVCKNVKVSHFALLRRVKLYYTRCRTRFRPIPPRDWSRRALLRPNFENHA